MITVDDLAQEIRRVDGSNSLGAGALAEAIMEYLGYREPKPVPESIELLPCPFCGGTKLLVGHLGGINCRSCCAEVYGAGSETDDVVWNRRALAAQAVVAHHDPALPPGEYVVDVTTKGGGASVNCNWPLAAQAVAVKQLNWDSPTLGPDEYAHIGGAPELGFAYRVEKKGLDPKPFTVTRTCDIQPFAWEVNLPLAVRSAQADFERRILSALASPPEPQDGWRDISTAPTDGSRILAWAKEWSAPSTAQHYGYRGWALDADLPPFLYQPTMWKPVPIAPKPEATE